jgi:hypothetical protein
LDQHGGGQYSGAKDNRCYSVSCDPGLDGIMLCVFIDRSIAPAWHVIDSSEDDILVSACEVMPVSCTGCDPILLTGLRLPLHLSPHRISSSPFNPVEADHGHQSWMRNVDVLIVLFMICSQYLHRARMSAVQEKKKGRVVTLGEC